MAEQNFTKDFQRFFLRGLAALFPTLLTIAILIWAYQLVNTYVGTPITNGLMTLCSWVSEQPAPGFVDRVHDPLFYGTPIDEWNEDGDRLTIEYKFIHNKALQGNLPRGPLSGSELKRRKHAEELRNQALWQIAFQKYKLNLVGFLIGIILVYFMGFFLASFIGRASWRAAEGVLYRVPLIRAIYPHVKQVTDFLLSERQVEFSGVVAVEYPRTGVWSLALSTGGPIVDVQDSDRTGDDLVTVFIPSSPTPVTGYVVQVPRRDTIALSISIDEALRFTISGGVIKPGALLPDGTGPVRAKDREDKGQA